MKTIKLFVLSLALVFNSETKLNAQVIDLKKGLVAYYPFDGNANDESGNGNNGKIFGGVYKTSDRFGNINNALKFNGKDGYISVPSSASLKSPGNELSITCWLYINDWFYSNTNWAPICCKSNSGEMTSVNYGAIIGNENIYMWNIQGYPYIPKLKKWLFVAAIFKHNTANFYIDGIYIGKVDNQPMFMPDGIPIGTLNNQSNFPKNDLPLEIGRDTPGGIELLNGKLDELRIYNKGLNEKEINYFFHEGENNNNRIADIITEQIKTWKQRGKFEKTEDYNKRIKPENVERITEQYRKEAIQQVAGERIIWSSAQNNYDPDKEIFTITFKDFQPFDIKTPISDAFLFDKNFKDIQYNNPQFILEGEQLAFSYLEITNPANFKTYVYKRGAIIEEAAHPPPKDIVDTKIPLTEVKQEQVFALIIGNEDYHSYQTGLSAEADVQFAANDANIFKEYCIKTMGVPDKNIELLTNATAGRMKQKITLVSKMAKAYGNDSEIIFYYAGHGLPDENTREPYLIPVDISGHDLQEAVKLATLYQDLSKSGASRVTVFLDACFSGGARAEGLIAGRSVKVKPKEHIIPEHMVVFSATTSEQSALPYQEKQHGMFTYFLLKKLNETAGNVSYDELFKYINRNVSLESLRINEKEQVPTVSTNAGLNGQWQDFKIH